MLAGDTVFLEGDVFSEREVLERTRQTMLATGQTVAVASFNASMGGSVVELAEDDSLATFFMHQTPVEAQARGLFKAIDPTRFCGTGLREQLAPALQVAVESGHRTAYVEQILASLWKAESPSFRRPITPIHAGSNMTFAWRERYSRRRATLYFPRQVRSRWQQEQDDDRVSS
ncbi:hypothetical protein [Bradyrhizobium sp. CSA112]|uniref:hypothetical protein n=1 Tax=Bradyrhizobium sp. CSA112 TaxID=2699170 RepID=UPI0023AF0FD8|nr:hypothetical protein [Bradyrhizobium sp. CSA112]